MFISCINIKGRSDGFFRSSTSTVRLHARKRQGEKNTKLQHFPLALPYFKRILDLELTNCVRRALKACRAGQPLGVHIEKAVHTKPRLEPDMPHVPLEHILCVQAHSPF